MQSANDDIIGMCSEYLRPCDWQKFAQISHNVRNSLNNDWPRIQQIRQVFLNNMVHLIDLDRNSRNKITDHHVRVYMQIFNKIIHKICKNSNCQKDFWKNSFLPAIKKNMHMVHGTIKSLFLLNNNFINFLNDSKKYSFNILIKRGIIHPSRDRLYWPFELIVYRKIVNNYITNILLEIFKDYGVTNISIKYDNRTQTTNIKMSKSLSYNQ